MQTARRLAHPAWPGFGSATALLPSHTVIRPFSPAVSSWPVGLPEYRIGHRRRVAEIRKGIEAFPSLTLAGNYLDGVGMPDCVRLGRKAVSRLALV